MGHVADGLVVSFAAAADEEWLIRSDSSRCISPRLVGEKIARKKFIVAGIQGDILGYIRLSTFWSFIPMIDIIAVDESLRRKGIGRALLGFLGRHARNTGCEVILSSSQADEPAPSSRVL